MSRIPALAWPLIVACLLAPWIGGQVSVDARPLTGPVLSELFGGWTPLTARFLVGSLVVVALAVAMYRRTVVTLPSGWPARLTFALVIVLAAVSFGSAYASSAGAWWTWFVYGAAFFAVPMSLGRGVGVRVALGALVAGCVVVSTRGVLDFAAIRATEPTFRIFSTWNNPNALAGMLVVGLPLAIGLAASAKERFESILWASGAALIGTGLLLTQSRGGALSAVVALVVFAAVALLWKGGKRVSWTLVPVALTALFAVGLSASQPEAASGAGISRVATVETEATQSVDFRINLWRGAIQLAQEEPLGIGIGAYRYESARPGLTTQTFMAHQSFLQLLVEGGALALLATLGIVATWFVAVFSGARSMPTQTNLLRAGVVAAVVGAGAHGFIDSQLFYLGSGFAVFVCLGAGLLLAADGVTPARLGPNTKWFGAVAGLAAIFFLSLGARAEIGKASALAVGPSEAPAALGALPEAFPGDGEAWYLAALATQNPNERIQRLKNAVALEPSTRFLRALARTQVATDDLESAGEALQLALQKDPNNLATLKLLMDVRLAEGDRSSARELAERAIAVEDTPYYQVRALPELVPTETFEARLLLAEDAERDERVRLVREALEGYALYAERTWPMVRRMGEADLPFAGETVQSAQDKMQTARAAADLLIAELDGGPPTDEVEALRDRLVLPED